MFHVSLYVFCTQRMFCSSPVTIKSIFYIWFVCLLLGLNCKFLLLGQQLKVFSLFLHMKALNTAQLSCFWCFWLKLTARSCHLLFTREYLNCTTLKWTLSDNLFNSNILVFLIMINDVHMTMFHWFKWSLVMISCLWYGRQCSTLSNSIKYFEKDKHQYIVKVKATVSLLTC